MNSNKNYQYSDSYSPEEISELTRLTPERKKAISALKSAAKLCSNCGLWLFMGNIVAYGKDPDTNKQCIIIDNDGVICQDFIMDTIPMHVDGGDF